MKKINLLAVVVAMAMLAACSGPKKETTATDSSSNTTVKKDTTLVKSTDTTMTDSVFAKKAAMGGMAEVALGKMAEGKTKNAKIKEFAKMMVMDHGKANDELLIIAKKNNINIPMTPDAMHQSVADSLKKLSGNDFDMAYVGAMIDGHNKTLALMKKEAATGSNPDLKAFAAKTAPVVQKHLDKINAIQTSMNQ